MRFIAVAVLALGLAAPLPAAVTISVDMDPATPGIQSIRTAAVNEPFTIDLMMTVDAAGVSSYGISANFDNAELSLNGAPASTELLPAGFTYNLNAGVSSESQALGQVRTFEAATLGNGPVSTSFVIGSISFTAAAPVTDGTADVTLGFFNVGVDGCFDNAGAAVVPIFVSGKVDLTSPLIVTSTADSGTGSLRTILAAAAAQAGADTITFDPALSGGTVTLASEIVVNDAAGVTLDAAGLPGGVTIYGGAGTNRIFSIVSGTTLNLAGLTLTGGNGTGAVESGYGGAIENQGTLTLTRCTLSGNSASNPGGAIDNFNGTLTLSHCTLSGNSASSGGGINNEGSTATTTLTHCTVSGNQAPAGVGGGIRRVSGTVNLVNSIVAGNIAASSADVSGTIVPSGNNLTTGDPLLAALGSYGGRTQSMALKPGSPARNASAGSTATSDQRGFPIVGTPDIGAYEAGTLANFAAWAVETTGTALAFGTDTESDGATNGLEYALRRNPAASDTPLAPTLTGPPGARLFTFRYRAAARDLRYIIQRSTDLTNVNNWLEIYRYDTSTGVITETLPATADENAATEIITLTDPAPGTKVFWRLRIEQVP